ncbi:hypothetical protein HY734_03400 [Candidatus Uhrbacteria bacterium]|nr:hypothetical protein [Candidatus Uhrbacteria bacterium]
MHKMFLKLAVMFVLCVQIVPLKALADEIVTPTTTPEVVVDVVPAVTQETIPETLSVEGVVPPVVQHITPDLVPVTEDSTPVPVAETESVTDDEEPSDPRIEETTKDFTNIIPQTTEYTCGPAALATLILQKGGAAGDEMAIVELSQTTEEYGTTLLGLKKAASSLGYDVKMKRWSLPALKIATLPVLVNDKAPDGSAHYSVVVAFTDSTVKLADTKLGNIELDIDDFEKSYTGTTLTITPKKTVTDGMSIEAVANILDANPSEVIAFDQDGNVIPVDQLDDVYDDEASTVTGKGGVSSVEISVKSLSKTMRVAFEALGVNTISAVVTASGQVTAISGMSTAMRALVKTIIGPLYDAIQLLVQKEMWTAGAALLNKNRPISSALMLHALKLNPKNIKITEKNQGSYGNVVDEIKGSQIFKDCLKSATSNAKKTNAKSFDVTVCPDKNGKTIDGIEFIKNDNKDLYTSIKTADIRIIGTQKNGTWNLTVKISDLYNFELHNYDINNWASWANNAAVVSLFLGVITKYDVVISFDTTR